MAQDSIRHSKGKTQRTTKNQKPTPSFPPKKKPPTLVTAWVKPSLLYEPNSFLDEQKQKGEKRKCSSWNEEEKEQKEEAEKLERSKKRSSWSARPFSAVSKLFANYCTNQLQILLCYCLILKTAANPVYLRRLILQTAANPVYLRRLILQNHG